MSRREDFYKTLDHQTPDNLILDLGGCPLSSMEGKSMYKLLDYLGYKGVERESFLPFGRVPKLDERILEYLDIDTRSVGYILTPQKSLSKQISETEYIDEWGIRRVFTGMYWEMADNPLKGAVIDDLEKFQWPDPDSVAESEIDSITERARYLWEDTDFVICGEHPVYGIFELGCWMCGFDDFLLKMAIDPDFVNRFFEIVLSYQKRIIEIYYGAIGNYIHYTTSGDDFATQDSLFFSKEMFKTFITPYFKERIDHTKNLTSAAFLHHSCGSVFEIIDELIACGVEILNPIQPKARGMDFTALKNRFGDEITFHGGIDTQAILPFGTKEEIEAEVQRAISILGRDGGYIFAAAHNIQEDVNPENLVTMFEAARNAW